MSRVGSLPVKIREGVKVKVDGRDVTVEGPKGKMHQSFPKGVKIRLDEENGQVVVEMEQKVPKLEKPLYGMTRSLIQNMVTGVSQGFTRELDIVGVGYRAAVQGNKLTLNLGYSHPVEFQLPEGVSAKVEKNTHLVLSGADNSLLGQVASKIRSLRPPEPYQGKGVRYTNEQLVRKQGKAAGGK